MNRIGLWTKAILALLAAVLNSALTALQDGHVEQFEWVAMVASGLVALAAVGFIRNAESGPLAYLKAILAAVIAAAGSFGTGIADGHVTPNEWVIICLALLSALPVAIAPNAEESDQFRLARRAAV